ncbi:MAG: hypothetical protein Fur0037_15900 [Planctomycetota bacterium]
MELEPEGILSNDPPVPPSAASDPVLERIEAALNEGRELEALQMAEDALAADEADRLDLLFLAGDALLRLGDARAAEVRFREILASDRDCQGTRCSLALSLFKQCRFEEAWEALDQAKAVPDPVSDVHVVEGLLLEREGKLREADECFRRAHDLDPEHHRLPIRYSKKKFDRQVEKAIALLPKEFRKHLDAVPVIVDLLPPEDLLLGDGYAEDPEILGLFDGVPLAETGDGLGGEISEPNYIYLFQRNIERFALDEKDLVEQVRVTLYHELAHYLGFDEEGVDDLGLA